MSQPLQCAATLGPVPPDAVAEKKRSFVRNVEPHQALKQWRKGLCIWCSEVEYRRRGKEFRSFLAAFHVHRRERAAPLGNGEVTVCTGENTTGVNSLPPITAFTTDPVAVLHVSLHFPLSSRQAHEQGSPAATPNESQAGQNRLDFPRSR